VLSNKKLLITLVMMSIIMFFPAQGLSSEETAPEPSMRVDRIDFPVLYLAEPELQGDAIWMMQAQLRELGYEIEPTGIFNEATCDVVKIFQIANNLKADGKVTQDVWEKLINEDADEPCLTQTEGKPLRRIEIDLAKHTLIVYDGEQVVKKFSVGSGTNSTPSPLGEWKVVQKSTKIGGPFGTRWMRLSVPWGVYGIHGTNQPGSIGWSSSHGCIRMRNKDAEALYPLIPVGTPVKIMKSGQIVPKYFKTRTLQEKLVGQDVVYLQYRLKEKGIVFGNVDGKYGKMTVLAVKYYQIWHGLKATGKVDTETYRSLGLIK
jgi:peptidoglycan hydrolase-like protein with peptidoglycan-binding domain